MRADKKSPLKSEKKTTARGHKRGVVGYSKKTALLEEAITQMNAGKYGRSSAALKELLALDPLNMEARRLFATLHLRLGSLIPARQAFESLINEAFERQDYWLAESLLREYLAAGPRCVPFLEKLGAVFQEKGNSLEAVTEYGKAIDILIEDPDPDNPQHAAQLYAKIRDLAPASPVAFRLASFFDAQTGELIAPPAVVHAEVEAPHPFNTPTEIVNETAGVAIPEPLAGVMPWEQVEEPTTPSLCPTPIEPITQPATSTNDPIEIDRQTDLAPSPHSLNQTDELHLELHLNDPIVVPGPEINTNLIPQGFHSDTAADIQPSRASIVAEDTPVALPKLETPPTIVTDCAPPVSSQESESVSPQDQGAAVPESISSPMPWEYVQESTIRIPDHVSDDLPSPHVQTEEPSTLTLHEHASLTESRDDSPNVAPLISDGTGHSQVVSVTDEPPMSAHESVPDIPPAPTLPERSKGPGFSWESVFDSAWKFGDKFSSSTPPMEAKQTDAKQQEEKTVDPGTASQEPSVIGPMPWDQVQDTIVTIPPAEVEVAAEVPEADTVPLEAAIAVPQEPASNQTPPEAVILPMQTATKQDSFSIAQPLPAPLSAEPEFRLLGMAAEHVVEALQRDREEAGPQPSPTTEVSAPADPIEAKPLAAHDEVNSTLPAGAQPFQLPAELKKDEVESPSIIADRDHDRLLKQQPVDPASFLVTDFSPKVEIVLAVPNQGEPTILSTEETAHPAPIGSALSIAEPESLVEVAPSLPADEQPLALAREEISPAAPAEHSIEHAQLSSVVETSAPTEVTRAASVEMPVAQPAMESAQTPPQFRGDPSHWSTGEVAVQSHRPTPKKRKQAAAPSSESASGTSQVEDRSALDQAGLRPVELPMPSVEARGGESVSQPVQEKDQWIRTGESIRFIEPEPSPRVEPAPQAHEQAQPRPILSTAASAVDVLFESSGRLNRSGPRERVPEPKSRPRLRAKLARARIGVVVFISSCFSTTRAVLTSLVALLLLSGALVALAIGAVGLTWTIMEERPSPAFQSLTTIPQHTLSDQKKNGYLLLLGFDAPAGQDPFQAGYERKPDAKDAGFAAACLGGPNGGPRAGQTTASASVASGWFQGSDPVAQFKTHQDTVKGWMSQAEPALGRYKQWLKLPFEDWGYGQTVSPPCSSILFAHQLYLADGFVLSVDAGVDRLETDMEAWRIALGQAKTLPVKTMALEAINNDVAVASGLLVKPDFDGRLLGRLTKMLRPLDQVELSIRWPMQSELVTASKTFDAQMKAVRGDELPWHVMVASALPLPKHRRFNDYASYYEASYKAAGEGRYGSLPKWGHYIHFPAHTLADYLTNPIENIVGLEPLPAWDRYNGMVVDADAHLRLASLQAWLRRGPQDADLLARIAKAGQSVYDPYTGLPMLVNLKRGVMYSVGHDGEDQDADPQMDVVVAIPLSPSAAISPRSTSPKFK